jgi:hypothetical protein
MRIPQDTRKIREECRTKPNLARNIRKTFGSETADRLLLRAQCLQEFTTPPALPVEKSGKER